MMFLDCPAYLDQDGTVRCGLPAELQRRVRRPNGAPAYYLGRPAALWITAMRPRRRPTAFRYQKEAAVALISPR